MKYMGSKAKIWKDIAPIILKESAHASYYVEPFVGGANSICHVQLPRIGTDINPFIIQMWQGLIDGAKYPIRIDRGLYNHCRVLFYSFMKEHRAMDGETMFLVAFVGFAASFNGRFYDGGYCGAYSARNYIDEQIRGIERQVDLMRDVDLYCCDYDSCQIPDHSIVYCDPPYRNSKQYIFSRDFDYDRFYRWCRQLKQNQPTIRIFVSEYQMPDDFRCVWEKEVATTINPHRTKRPTEKLYVL
jgi:DNA adenine methylase